MAVRKPLILNAGNLEELSSADTITPDATAWTTYTPTVTALNGSYTTLGTIIGRYKQSGKIVFLHIEIPITTNGTADWAAIATLPSGLGGKTGSYFIMMGKEVSVTSHSLAGIINPNYDSSKISINRYDGAYSGANGYRLVVDGVYETN